MFRTKEPMNVILFADWTRACGVKAEKGKGKAIVSLKYFGDHPEWPGERIKPRGSDKNGGNKKC